MTADEFLAAKNTLGLSFAQLAQRLGYAHGRNIQSFADGSRAVPFLVALVLRMALASRKAREVAGL